MGRLVQHDPARRVALAGGHRLEANLKVVYPDKVYAPTVGEFLTEFSALPPEAFGDPEAVADAVMAPELSV